MFSAETDSGRSHGHRHFEIGGPSKATPCLPTAVSCFPERVLQSCSISGNCWPGDIKVDWNFGWGSHVENDPCSLNKVPFFLRQITNVVFPNTHTIIIFIFLWLGWYTLFNSPILIYPFCIVYSIVSDLPVTQPSSFTMLHDPPSSPSSSPPYSSSLIPLYSSSLELSRCFFMSLNRARS